MDHRTTTPAAATLDPHCRMPMHGHPDAPSACCRPRTRPRQGAEGGSGQAIPAPAPWRSVWRPAAQNTLVCLAGCTIGDVGVVVAAAVWFPHAPMLPVMALAIVAGLLTSIAFETVWLARRGHPPRAALRTALGMSLVSMVAMELAMNAVDLGLGAGGPMHLGWAAYAGILALGEVAGFAASFPYNAWRLRHGHACH